jgi:hypothetical protein
MTIRDEHRLRLFENRVLRRVFGPNMYEIIRGWRKLHNEALHNLFSSPIVTRITKSRRNIWAWHVARIVEKRNAYRVLVEKPEGKRPQRRPRHKWKDTIKMDLLEIVCYVHWINLAQVRDQWQALVNKTMNHRIPLNVRKL